MLGATDIYSDSIERNISVAAENKIKEEINQRTVGL